MYQSAPKSVVISQCNARLGQIRNKPSGDVSSQRTLDHGPKVSSTCLTIATFMLSPRPEISRCSMDVISSPPPPSRRSSRPFFADGFRLTPDPEQRVRIRTLPAATSVRQGGSEIPPYTSYSLHKESVVRPAARVAFGRRGTPAIPLLPHPPSLRPRTKFFLAPQSHPE